jgi:hypothetical protein
LRKRTTGQRLAIHISGRPIAIHSACLAKKPHGEPDDA